MRIEFDINKIYKDISVIIKAPSMTDEVRQIEERINNRNDEVIGRLEDKIYVVKLKDVIRFYTENQKVKFDTEDKSLEVKMKLYEIEETFDNGTFVRVSKFAIVNVKKIINIEARNGGLVINLANKKVEPISRRYVKVVKKFIGMGGK